MSALTIAPSPPPSYPNTTPLSLPFVLQVCTLDNDGFADACGACEGPRPVGAAGAGAAPPPAAAAARAPHPPASSDPNAPVPLDDGSGLRLVRRPVPADNSCLFRAVALLTSDGRGGDGGMAGHATLREACAREIEAWAQRDPGRFGPAALDGRTASEYVAWLRKPESWGGGVELAALARLLRAHLWAVCARTGRIDRFAPDSADAYSDGAVFGANGGGAAHLAGAGGGGGRDAAHLVLYDGAHYDALVGEGTGRDGRVVHRWSTRPGEPGGRLGGGGDGGAAPAARPSEAERAAAAAQTMARRLAAAGRFVDADSFTLRCTQCRAGLTGAADAKAHAEATGHVGFQQYQA